MSYILDALKKANAEREHERGSAPGLYTQPARAAYESPTRIGGALKKRPALLWVLVAALLLCMVTVGALFWPLPSRTRSSPVPPPALPTTPIPPITTVPPPNGGTANPANSASAAAPADTSPPPTNPVRVTPAPHSLAPQTQPLTEPSPTMAQSAPPTIGRPRPLPPPAPPAPQPMPASVRAALPPLVISGSTYSDNPAYRMLIINGQVYREGDFPTPDLKLEQIRPKSALLHYKGSTYLLPY